MTSRCGLGLLLFVLWVGAASASAEFVEREITFSLKTRDPREAVQRVRIESVKLDQEFAEVRRRSAAEPATTLSNLDIQRLAAASSCVRSLTRSRRSATVNE